MKLGEAWEWIKSSPTRITVFVVCAAVLVVALIALVLDWAPHWLASSSGLNPDQRAADVGRVRTALLALLAGGIAVVGAIYTARTYSLNRQGHELDRRAQITERFTRAVDQLGSEKLDVRLGGIYALERLAQESREDHGPIVEILTAFVREHAPDRSSESDARKPTDLTADRWTITGTREQPELTLLSASPRPSTDVQAVLTVLGRREASYDMDTRVELPSKVLTGAQLVKADLATADLFAVDLRHADLQGADLSDALLAEADLAYALLDDAKLIRAFLWRTNLTAARLIGAKLEGADLHGAELAAVRDGDRTRPANLARADLTDANLEDANLTGATLADADLKNVNLDGAILVGAFVVGANLMKASLRGADLTGVNLAGAVLMGAILAGANLTGAIFDAAETPRGDLWKVMLSNGDGERKWASANPGLADLTGAWYDDATVWPAGFDPSSHGARME
jgi:uncharacterized protein YjbI with pentapeptide repeats